MSHLKFDKWHERTSPLSPSLSNGLGEERRKREKDQMRKREKREGF